MTDDPGPVAPDPDAHLGLDALADLEEGLLPAGESSSAEQHLTGCRPCREQQARLRSTRVLLSALPAEPMPPDVADRVHDALSRAPMSGTVLPLVEPQAGRGSRWRSRPTIAGLGAAAAVVALIAAVVVGALHDSPPPDSASTAAGPSADDAAAPEQSFPITASGRHYNSVNAERLVTRLAGQTAQVGTEASTGAGTGAEVAPQSAAAAVAPSLRPLYTSQQALLTCVAALSAGGNAVLPLTVDFGTFTDKARKIKNEPALVVVLPGTAGHADGWIVGPNCATAPDNNLYLFKRVPLG
jgi:hypothetical protein